MSTQLNFSPESIQELIKSNPSKVPVSFFSKSDKTKRAKINMMVARNYKMQILIGKVKNALSIAETESLVFFCKEKTIPLDITVEVLYEKHKDQQGILNISYRNVEAFGSNLTHF